MTENICPICLISVQEKLENNNYVKLKCGHEYHELCIKKEKSKDNRNNENGENTKNSKKTKEFRIKKCAICREKINLNKIKIINSEGIIKDKHNQKIRKQKYERNKKNKNIDDSNIFNFLFSIFLSNIHIFVFFISFIFLFSFSVFGNSKKYNNTTFLFVTGLLFLLKFIVSNIRNSS